MIKEKFKLVPADAPATHTVRIAKSTVSARELLGELAKLPWCATRPKFPNKNAHEYSDDAANARRVKIAALAQSDFPTMEDLACRVVEIGVEELQIRAHCS